ncbi:hypothetical protein AX17_002803 [Amanita inopinata Kibby_2008]|nr:hypothetical protein AX17_002803 [Amanita inopinata Kibby_2008]
MGFVACFARPQSAPAAANLEKKTDNDDADIVRSGLVRVKKQGAFSGWRKKCVVLQDDTLTFYRSKYSAKQAVIHLRDVKNVERVDAKPYCLLVEANNQRYLLSLNNDEELYDWQDDVYLRTPMGEGLPFNFAHEIHVGVDPVTGVLTGLPSEQTKSVGRVDLVPKKDDADQGLGAFMDALELTVNGLKRTADGSAFVRVSLLLPLSLDCALISETG